MIRLCGAVDYPCRLIDSPDPEIKGSGGKLVAAIGVVYRLAGVFKLSGGKPPG